MTWIDVSLIGLLAVSLGGWWDARKEAAGWKRAFANLFNSMAKNAIGKP